MWAVSRGESCPWLSCASCRLMDVGLLSDISAGINSPHLVKNLYISILSIIDQATQRHQCSHCDWRQFSYRCHTISLSSFQLYPATCWCALTPWMRRDTKGKRTWIESRFKERTNIRRTRYCAGCDKSRGFVKADHGIAQSTHRGKSKQRHKINIFYRWRNDFRKW